MTELSTICQQVIEISKQAGAFIRDERYKINVNHVQSKGTHDFVTYVDKTAEKLIIENLQKLLPQSGFIAEENTVETKNEEYMWIIDPLDGTTNFIHGLPCFSVSIGLMHNQKLILGVVYEVNLDECFYAWKGSPAYLNGKEIRASGTKNLKDSLLATGFPYHDYSLLEKYMELFTWCLHNTHGVRRIGSAAVDLVYVACGRFEAFFEYGLNSWDVAAGSFILQQAGGKVTDFDGKDNFIFGKQLVATNALIHEEFLGNIQKTFKMP